jgi:hypothetical protein
MAPALADPAGSSYHPAMRTFTILQTLAAVGVVGVALGGCAGPAGTDPSPAAGVTRDFVATTIAGDEISGESLRGHVTIIDFFAVF